MVQPKQFTAFQLLQSMSENGRQAAVTLPKQNEFEGLWRGVGFQLAGIDFIVPMSEIDEVLYMPSCTQLPGVKPWVTGVANIRGRLLSVIDLGIFFGNTSSVVSEKCRLLVVKKDDLYVGVIVEKVLGIQNLVTESQIKPLLVDDKYQPYVTSGFEQDEHNWAIFSLSKLVDAPEFLQVAV